MTHISERPERASGLGSAARIEDVSLAPHFAVSPIADSRGRLAKLYLLTPEHTPSAVAITRTVPQTLRAYFRDAMSLRREALDTAFAVSQAFLPVSTSSRTQNLELMIAKDASADLETHDTYFNIGRRSHAHAGFYLQSALQALVHLRTDIEETPTSLQSGKLSKIDFGLRLNLAAALGIEALPSRWTHKAPARPAYDDHVIRRWIRGHQIFAALTQGLIFANEAFHQATLDGDLAARGTAAEHLFTGLEACGCALELTGDFSSEYYQAIVRPSMDVPYQPKGFSGLLSADHAHLVRRMKATRASMERLRDEDPPRHAAVVRALAGVYDSHKYVCGRFVGADTSSLLMKSDMCRSSVDQLERFKATRIRQLV